MRIFSAMRCVRPALLVAFALLFSVRADAHVFIFDFYRAGAAPQHEGQGWIAEVYLNIPDESAIHLLAAEQYVEKRVPDFTFRTPYIDFPAGPVAFRFDNEFETMGDFLDDYIYDVSDPSKLDEPFGNFLIKFRGYLRVELNDDHTLTPGLSVWVEFGTIGFDGFRTAIEEQTIYRLPIVNENFPFFHENSIVLGLGLFPIEITTFNRYDPKGVMRHAGIEFYSWHGGALNWPAGENLVHPVFGAATIVPPRVIYQFEDIRPLVKGDFDADFDIDVLDFQWLQTCFTGPGGDDVFLDEGCNALDFDDDNDVDVDDFAAFAKVVGGPGVEPQVE